jgi:hypothetical protein
MRQMALGFPLVAAYTEVAIKAGEQVALETNAPARQEDDEQPFHERR